MTETGPERSDVCRALEGVFFPKKRYKRTKNVFFYSKKTCDCDFGILNSYCHQGNPDKYIGHRWKEPLRMQVEF